MNSTLRQIHQTKKDRKRFRLNNQSYAFETKKELFETEFENSKSRRKVFNMTTLHPDRTSTFSQRDQFVKKNSRYISNSEMSNTNYKSIGKFDSLPKITVDVSGKNVFGSQTIEQPRKYLIKSTFINSPNKNLIQGNYLIQPQYFPKIDNDKFKFNSKNQIRTIQRFLGDSQLSGHENAKEIGLKIKRKISQDINEEEPSIQTQSDLDHFSRYMNLSNRVKLVDSSPASLRVSVSNLPEGDKEYPQSATVKINSPFMKVKDFKTSQKIIEEEVSERSNVKFSIKQKKLKNLEEQNYQEALVKIKNKNQIYREKAQYFSNIKMDFLDSAQAFINTRQVELEPVNHGNPLKHEGIQIYKDLLQRYHLIEKIKKEAEINWIKKNAIAIKNQNEKLENDI